MDNENYFFTSKERKNYKTSLVYYKNFEKFREKIDNFFSIYSLIFTDEYTENKEEIISRAKFNTNPITYIGICEDVDNNIVGGYILETYKETKSVLLNYLFVIEGCRKKNIGGKLIESIEYFYSEFLQLEVDTELKFLFFETKSTNEYSLSTKYGHVGEFFTKKGGLWIDLPYIEPLSESSQYFLGAIPIKKNNLRENLLKTEIKDFLDEFYILTKPSISDKKEVKLLLNSINKEEKVIDILKEFPKIIVPKLKFKRVSISFHVIQDDENILFKTDIDNRYCRVFNSFEKDLFSQKYIESNTPYFSKHIDIREIDILFKNNFHFNSEGREETFIITDESYNLLDSLQLKKKAKVYLNHTYFILSNIFIWEIVICPIDYFNEYELIQLEKYFTGKQEGVEPDLVFFSSKNLSKN